MDLIAEYHRTKDKSIRNQIVLEYENLVKHIVKKIYKYQNSVWDYQDLYQEGIIGLIYAIEKFDIDRNVAFKTFAYMKVYGHIIDSLRNLDFYTRSYREKHEVQTILSYDDLILHEAEDSFANVEKLELCRNILKTVRTMTVMQQLFFRLRYLFDFPIVKITETLLISQGRCSQINKSIVKKLRSKHKHE